MARSFQEKRFYPASEDHFVNKLKNIGSSGLNIAFKSENPTPSGAWYRLHHGTSWSSWGEKITVTLNRYSNGIEVDILSQCGLPTQLVDYGKNRQNVHAIFGYLEAGMPISGNMQNQQAPQSGAPGQVPAQPTAQVPPAQNGMFCTSCGAKNIAQSNFCTTCGAKLG